MPPTTKYNHSQRATRRAMIINEARTLAGEDKRLTREQVQLLADKWQFSRCYIRQICLWEGLGIRRPLLPPPPKGMVGLGSWARPRTFAILKDLLDHPGDTLEQVAVRHGVTRQRVEQVRLEAHRCGLIDTWNRRKTKGDPPANQGNTLNINPEPMERRA